MNNPISDFTDELVEQGKDMVKIAKKQILSHPSDPSDESNNSYNSNSSNSSNNSNESDKSNKSDKKTKAKVDPTTGKPIPSKKVLTDLQTKVAQLQQVKLKQIREDLDKQRLKVSDDKNKLSPIETAKKQGFGPAVDSSEKEPKDNAVQTTLKASKSTGEFKGLIGG